MREDVSVIVCNNCVLIIKKLARNTRQNFLTFKNVNKIGNKGEKIVFCLLSDSTLQFHNRTHMKFSILSEFDKNSLDKRQLVVELLDKLMKNKNEINNIGFLQIIKKSPSDEYEMTPEPLRELLMLNLLEQNIVNRCFSDF